MRGLARRRRSGWQSGDDEGPGRPAGTAPVNQGKDGLHHGTGRTDRVHTGPRAHAQDGRPADGDDGRPRRGDAAPTTTGSEFKKAPFVDPLTMQEDIVWLTAKVELREEDALVREALKTMPEDWFLRFVRGAMYEADAAARVKLAKKAITRSVHWRRKNGIDRILERPFPAIRLFRDKVWPMRVLGTDDQGHLVLVLRLAECDWETACRDIDKADLLELMAMYQEALAAHARSIGARCAQVVLVDCSGLTWKDFRTAINHGLGSIFNMWARHYPSTLQALYLLHCPVVVKALFRAVRAWIEPDTLPKITLLSGGSAVKAATRFQRSGIPLHCIPQDLGGKAKASLINRAYVLPDGFVQDKEMQRFAFLPCNFRDYCTRRNRSASGGDYFGRHAPSTLHAFRRSDPCLREYERNSYPPDHVHENEEVSEEEECRKMRDTRCLGFGFKKIEGSRLSSRDVGNGGGDDGGGGGDDGDDDDDDDEEEEAKDAESSASEGCSSPRIRRLLSLVTASPRTGDSFPSSWKLFSPGRAQQARKEPIRSPSPRLPSLAEASDSLWPLRGKTIDLIMWEDHAVTFAFVFSSHLILGTLRVLSADIVILSAFAFWGVWSAIWASEAVRCLCPSLYLLSSDLSAAWASVLFDVGDCFSSIVSILDQTMQNSRKSDAFVKVSASIVFALFAVNFVDIIFIAHGALIAIFFVPSMLKVLIF